MIIKTEKPEMEKGGILRMNSEFRSLSMDLYLMLSKEHSKDNKDIIDTASMCARYMSSGYFMDNSIEAWRILLEVINNIDMFSSDLHHIQMGLKNLSRARERFNDKSLFYRDPTLKEDLRRLNDIITTFESSIKFKRSILEQEELRKYENE